MSRYCHLTWLIYLTQGYHHSEAVLLTSVSVISATISSSLKTRISKSSEPTRSWGVKIKISHIEFREWMQENFTGQTSIYMGLLSSESCNPAAVSCSGRFFLVGGSTGPVSEEEMAKTLEFTCPVVCTSCQNPVFHWKCFSVQQFPLPTDPNTSAQDPRPREREINVQHNQLLQSTIRIISKARSQSLNP